MAKAILVLAEDWGIRQTLLRLTTEAGFTHADRGGPPAVVLFGCRERIEASDLSVARAVSGWNRGVFRSSS